MIFLTYFYTQVYFEHRFGKCFESSKLQLSRWCTHARIRGEKPRRVGEQTPRKYEDEGSERVSGFNFEVVEASESFQIPAPPPGPPPAREDPPPCS